MIVLSDIDGCVINPCEFVKKYLHKPKKDWNEYFKHTLEMPSILPVVVLLTSLISAGHDITFMTGRPESNREDTNRSLTRAIPVSSICHLNLLMRKNGDRTESALLKLAWCMQWHPSLVLEDEPETVKLLSNRGYTVLQVHGYRVDEFKDNVPE